MWWSWAFLVVIALFPAKWIVADNSVAIVLTLLTPRGTTRVYALVPFPFTVFTIDRPAIGLASYVSAVAVADVVLADLSFTFLPTLCGAVETMASFHAVHDLVRALCT